MLDRSILYSRNLLENVINYAGSTSKIIPLPEKFAIMTLKFLDFLKLSPLAPWHYLTYHKPFYFDVRPLLNLGWEAKYSNDEMIKESYDLFLKAELDDDIRNQTLSKSMHRKPVKQKLLKFLKKIS